MSISVEELETSDLPEGWTICAIGDVAQVVGGGTPKASDPSNFAESGTGVPWITPADLSGYRERYISRGRRDLSAAGLRSCSAKLLPKGSVLFSSRAPIGYVAIASNEIATNQGFRSFVCGPRLVPEFLYYYLMYIRPLAEMRASGTTFLEISGTNAARLPLILPPLPEQRRIVEKIEALLARVNAARDRLTRVPAILKRLRQSILVAACSGRLTEDRRQTVDGLFDEVGIQQAQSLDSASELPPYWVWGTLGSLTVNHDGKRVPIKAEDRAMRSGAYPYYGASGVIDSIDDYLFDGEYLLIAEDGANLLARSTPIAFKASGQFWVNNHAHIVQTRGDVSLTYVEHYLNSLDVQTYVTGTAQPKLTQSALNSIPVPLPPLEEQHEIVARVEALLSLEERIRARAKGATTKSEQLLSAILNRAFHGDLLGTIS